MNLLQSFWHPLAIIKKFTLWGGGSGGGGGPTNSKVENTNIPEYARPYVENMLGATQQQLFNVDSSGTITGVKPFRAFGQNGAGLGPGEMNAASSAVAGFDPLQQQAYNAVGGLETGSAMQAGLGGTAAGTAQALGAGRQYANMATNPYAVQAYMSPYMQNVVDVQQREAQRMSDIAGTQQRGQATQQGAFGGSRQALMEAERQRNLATQQGQIQATGLQSAFDQARQAQQFGANLGLQGAQAGMAGAGQLYQQGAGNLGLQNQMGAQQQAYNQSVLNQAIQNYANVQQYPQQQLAFMNAQLRGLPLQSTTTQSYQAAPSMTSQLAGLGTAAYGVSRMGGMGGSPSAKKGGLPKDFEKKKDKTPGGLQALALSKM
jgi:hypothetical protein